MFVRMLAPQIRNSWAFIRQNVKEAAPILVEDFEKLSANIFESLIRGSMQCWVSYKEKEGKKTLNGICVTETISGGYTQDVNLMIYAIRTFVSTDDFFWQEAIEALNAYAKHVGCNHICAYTDKEAVIKRVENLGFSHGYVFITKEVE